MRLIPVVVLNSSHEPPDLEERYRLGANAYVVKSVRFIEFVDAVKQIGVFWRVPTSRRPMGRGGNAPADAGPPEERWKMAANFYASTRQTKQRDISIQVFPKVVATQKAVEIEHDFSDTQICWPNSARFAPGHTLSRTGGWTWAEGRVDQGAAFFSLPLANKE